MHDLPHCITASMHQCMFIFICIFIVNKQTNKKTLTSIKETVDTIFFPSLICVLDPEKLKNINFSPKGNGNT